MTSLRDLHSQLWSADLVPSMNSATVKHPFSDYMSGNITFLAHRNPDMNLSKLSSQSQPVIGPSWWGVPHSIGISTFAFQTAAAKDRHSYLNQITEPHVNISRKTDKIIAG